MKNFFQRPKSATYSDKFVPAISKQLNLDNIDTIKKRKVRDLFQPKTAKDYLAYRFDLLREWIAKNQQYTKQFLIDIDMMVDKLYLINELNSHEQQYITNLKAVVFAQVRNLKQLIVDFSVNKNELVFYRYDLNAFKQIDKRGLVQIFENAELYITTQRIIVSKSIDIISMYYKNIQNYIYKNDKLIVNLCNGQQCYIDSDNNMAINESLKRVLKRQDIKFK